MAIAAMFPALSAMAGGATATAVGMSTAQMALTGLQIAGTMFSAVEATKQASAANKRLAQQAVAAQQLQAEQSRQITEQGQAQMGRVAQQALAERGRMVVESSEAGIGGGVLERMANEIGFNQEQAYQDIRDTQLVEQTNLFNQGYANRKAMVDQQGANSKMARSAWIQSGLKLAGTAMDFETKARVEDSSTAEEGSDVPNKKNAKGSTAKTAIQTNPDGTLSRDGMTGVPSEKADEWIAAQKANGLQVDEYKPVRKKKTTSNLAIKGMK